MLLPITVITMDTIVTLTGILTMIITAGDGDGIVLTIMVQL